MPSTERKLVETISPEARNQLVEALQGQIAKSGLPYTVYARTIGLTHSQIWRILKTDGNAGIDVLAKLVQASPVFYGPVLEFLRAYKPPLHYNGKGIPVPRQRKIDPNQLNHENDQAA